MTLTFAHSINEQGERHDLVAHLQAVADLAAGFAAPLGAAEAGRWLGRWHDLGKFHPAFQAYLRRCEIAPVRGQRGPDHKAAGASVAARRGGPLALVIQGHHGGLRNVAELRSWLAERSADPAVEEALSLARAAIPRLEPDGPVPVPAHVEHNRDAAELFLRLVFSAVVDADSLDTERHFHPARADRRRGSVPMAELWRRFEHDQQAKGYLEPPTSTVGRARQEIYRACLAAADRPPGLFRLTVPTGGGKTRSAMAFALRHALRHGHERVIVAVPFLTITEQTADEYRRSFGASDDGRPTVLEHHSHVSDTADDEGSDPRSVWARLAAENWDAPVVVTTTVQLFESLFANRPGRCRKVHRLANSVIILDEAQALLFHLLDAILDALRQLCNHYGSTVVLSTATQPAFDAIPLFAATPTTEIVPQPERFFRLLRRVEFEWPTEPLDWPDVAGLLREVPQGLAILNTKRDALALLDALDDPTVLHLSTWLCGAHRRAVIAEVRRRLAAGQPCRLVSTQVVEAGVDIDFPVVFRALGPLDAVIQAAGRCNREGRLKAGRTVVFRSLTASLPQGAYRTATGVTEALLSGDRFDPDDPTTSRTYFERLFQVVDTDRERIQALRHSLDYPEIALRFRMIDEQTVSVVVPYGTAAERATVRRLIERLRRGTPEGRSLLRRLQPYVVSVRTGQLEREGTSDLVAPVLEGFGEWLGAYHPIHGLGDRRLDAGALVG